MNIISIKVNEYIDIFNEYDYNQISKRRLSEDLDVFLQQELMDKILLLISLLLDKPIMKKNIMVKMQLS